MAHNTTAPRITDATKGTVHNDGARTLREHSKLTHLSMDNSNYKHCLPVGATDPGVLPP